MPPQTCDYFIVLDFEATCEEAERDFVSEIIEFPMVVMDSATGKIVAEFRQYVRPVVNSTLTPFCTELTGITQHIVDAAAVFPEVFVRAQSFVERFHKNHPGATSIFVTCGDWDLQNMLPKQARLSKVKVPHYFQEWVNVKIPFKENFPSYGGTKTGGYGMWSMLNALKLPLIGRHHSGLDDSRNIASILFALIQKGSLITATTRWSKKLVNQLSV